MSIVSKKILFLHIPKTGGRFVSSVIRTSGIYANPIFTNEKYKKAVLSKYKTHAKLVRCREFIPGRISFTFVRHPIAWYNSVYHHCFGKKGKKGSWFGELYRQDISDFIVNIIENHPGYFTQLVKKYAGEDLTNPEVTYIGKLETVREDIVRFLDEAGEEYDRNFILNAPILDHHRTPKKYPDAKIKEKFHEKIKQMDAEIYDIFNYK